MNPPSVWLPVKVGPSILLRSQGGRRDGPQLLLFYQGLNQPPLLLLGKLLNGLQYKVVWQAP